MNNTTDTPFLKISEYAVSELKQLIAKETSGKTGIRVGVKGGGCSGLTYILDVDNPTDQDLVMELDGLQVMVNKAQHLYLAGVELTYDKGLNNRGFIFENPNAKETCGCGTSFAV